MWFSFWRSKDRFTLDELRYLTDQLMKVQFVNDVNKDFVIEALRSIAELITYGDQHDANFFEFFMEKQIMGEFVRILKISKNVSVSIQLLQTMSIMIQNLKSDHSIYYLFSNEHINFLITYSYDFRNEELLLSYYLSFLRAISGKLNKNTISLLVKTEKDEIVAFPLYVEAIRYAFHEDGMNRTAVRALTLNIYHVKFFRDRCIKLNGMVSATTESQDPESVSSILSAVDEVEDNLYYLNDVVSAGIPDVGALITDSMLKLLIFPLLLPSLRIEVSDGKKFSPVTSLFLLVCVLRILKIKDLANTIAAALICSIQPVLPNSEAKLNGFKTDHDETHETDGNDENPSGNLESSSLIVSIPSLCTSSSVQHYCSGSASVLRDALISYITNGDDMEVVGSLSLLATFLHTKELDESMLDALGILPQRKQHKKLLLKALVGEDSGEEQLFASENCISKDGSDSELNIYLQRLKDQYEVSCSYQEVGESPRVHRFLVLDALISLFCRTNISADTLWDGGWLLRQLLPYSETEFNTQHLQSLKESCKKCRTELIVEQRGSWPDLLIHVLCDEWRKCKRAIEASSPRREPKSILFSTKKSSPSDVMPIDSSFAAGEMMYHRVKVFVLLHELKIFSTGKSLPDQPPILPPADFPEISRAKSAGLTTIPKLSTELNLVDSVPCRIAFERGKERHFSFLAISIGISGWIILAEELPQKTRYGTVRVVAPLAGCNPRIDERHTRWLHLRIRPSTLPLTETEKNAANLKLKSKSMVDGRWTLAFKDEASCKSALTMIQEEINLQCTEVERRLAPLLSDEV
ncbi:protein TRANSPARENT TESTA 9 isoform X2 [Rutidosis leptorrhynchoides]|uniref:protein TRANSPARENT TESTA 9 isoform X2 n=1 Tax=Rutidosis leptorrhynchoides TaxID=125765 RepID=UPI003A99FF81